MKFLKTKSILAMLILSAVISFTQVAYAESEQAEAAASCISNGCGMTFGCDANGSSRGQARARASSSGSRECRQNYTQSCPKFKITSESCTQLSSGKWFCALNGKCKA